jgi:hypothetical protein
MPARLGTFGRWVIEGVQPDDIATLVAPRLAEPSEIGPAVAKVVGEDEPLKLSPTKVFKVNRPAELSELLSSKPLRVPPDRLPVMVQPPEVHSAECVRLPLPR